MSGPPLAVRGSALDALGWDERAESLFAPHAAAGREPARVLVEHRGQYVVDAGKGEIAAVVSGRLRHGTRSAEEFPAVGDWVAVSTGAGSDAVIHAVLPRASRFARPSRGDIPGAQVVAANVDIVLVVAALDRDFNLRRLERYLALAWSSGARPVVVLSKADVAADLSRQAAAVESVAPGVPILPVSARTGAGMDALRALLRPGETVALLGSSGVGKSTLVNTLLGWQRQATNDVRADDQRGRHTTTVRELIQLPGGGLLIDSPGMRSVGMWEADEGIDSAFADIDDLARGCRFSDCSHTAEPGCAVRAAIADGRMPEARLLNRRKLERELAAVERRRAPDARAEARRRGKMIGKAVRSRMRAKYGAE